jgi:tripartite-type tricarboxylate transporter receptor subunit TctC
MNWLKLSVLACSLVWGAPHAHAAEYPVRPIKLIVPYAAGGPTDVLGRMVGDYLSRDLKQPVVVENKAGAQGAIGADAAARRADGYTLFLRRHRSLAQPAALQEAALRPAQDFRCWR